MKLSGLRWKGVLLLSFLATFAVSDGYKDQNQLDDVSKQNDGGSDITSLRQDLDYWGMDSNEDSSNSSDNDNDTLITLASSEEITTVSTPKDDADKPRETSKNQTDETNKSTSLSESSSLPKTLTSLQPKKDDKISNSTSTTAPAKKAENEDEYQLDWGDDSDEEVEVAEDTKSNLNLPSDSDLDSEKYFDPSRYEDRIMLHTIEDLLNREWSVTYPDTNLPCIILRGNIKMIMPISPSWFNTDYVELDVPVDAKATGTCLSLNNDYQEIILKWNTTVSGTQLTYTNSIYFGFSSNWTSEFSEQNVPADKYALTAITTAYYNGELNVNDDNADKGLASVSVSDLKLFETPINQSMSCFKQKSIIIKDIQLSFENIQLEAFRPNTETLTPGEFSSSILCDTDEEYLWDGIMSFIIWFWVGALLILITIFGVLLAMGYRRRQNQKDGTFAYKILEA